MKIIVPIKRVIDYQVRIHVKSDGSGVETDNVKHSMNPFDEIAIEEAVRLKEAGVVSVVIAVSIGSDKCQETIRHAMALGADRGIHVQAEGQLLPLTVAKVLKSLAEKESPDLVIMGKQSIDGDNNQTGQMLAALLDWPQGTFVSKLEIKDKTAMVTREIDGGLETLALTLPAVITSDLRLNEPRYATMPNIMQAKQKPLDSISLDELNIDLANGLEIVKIEAPQQERKNIMCDSVEELIKKIQDVI